MKYLIVIFSVILMVSCKNEAKQEPLDTTVIPVDSLDVSSKLDSLDVLDENR